MQLIELPHKFMFRGYQRPLAKSILEDKKKHAMAIWHRRAGKDKTCLNIAIAAAQQRVGTYLYLFPETTHAKRVIWKGIDREGNKFLDHFPPELCRKPNNMDLSITFHNGSIFQLGGSNQYDRLMGTNPVGIVYSEYPLQNPQARHYLRPILAENGGWELLEGTPRGHNHGFELYEMAKDNPEWFCQLLTIKDTKRDDGSPVITEEIVQKEREEGVPEDIIDQEYYCSFNAAIRGAYYSDHLRAAEEQTRIFDYPIETQLPAYTYWDIGVRDQTAIWIMQPFRNEIRAIGYYEYNNQDIQFYLNWLKDFQAKHRITYAEHWAPHDIKVREFCNGARSRFETARSLGIDFQIAPKVDFADGIQAARSLFSRMYFHKTNCKHGLSALQNYHKTYDEKNKIYHDKPFHDWSSNGADAFRYFAVSWKDLINRSNRPSYVQLPKWNV